MIKFISEIEQNWEDSFVRQELIASFAVFLSYFEREDYRIASQKLFADIDRREFLKIVVPIEQELRHDQKDHQFLIERVDGERDLKVEFPVVLILDNLRSSFNVGAIIRSAECFGVTDIYFCGYTPDNEKVVKTSMGTREQIRAFKFADTADALESLRAQGYHIYALETASTAKSIYDQELLFPAALIVGNEALGISRDIIKLADQILVIPLRGWKNSLNVGAAAAIALSEFSRKQKSPL
ncbi:MAG: TrmH family RNA methyltransferase [Candidatus Cloacimonetes bacterium]|nr:TrmH family RNA methyltransferase [Candidatus Cloacimonadota bacterium]